MAETGVPLSFSSSRATLNRGDAREPQYGGRFAGGLDPFSAGENSRLADLMNTAIREQRGVDLMAQLFSNN